jgi:proteic killer suppression protein
MRFRFKTKQLHDLYTQEKGAHKYPSQVIDAFFEVMSAIAAARDERDLYALKGLRFEKLSGDRKGERSLRLTGQWRLIVIVEEDDQGKCLLITSIEDYQK